MRWIVALITLTCLLGGAAAQNIFTGEGYSNTQLAFLNEPDTAPLQPMVEKYWATYIQNAQNMTPAFGSNASNIMNIWFNTFPMRFEKEIQLKNSSFTVGALRASEGSKIGMESTMLKREINSKFKTDLSWKYTPPNMIFSSAMGNVTPPPKGAKGEILSQGIMSSFNI